jgi:protein TonB
MQQLITHKVEPLYPEDLRQRNVQGVVVLDAVIGRDGTVVRLRPISGPDALGSAAIEAVKWWRFRPYRVDGRAVEVETTLAVDFRRAP